MRYNYTSAAALWDEYYNLCIDPWTISSNERQQERRQFMYNLTRGIDKQIYIDYIKECIIDYRPIEGAKSRVFDFEYERQMQNIINKIETFAN